MKILLLEDDLTLNDLMKEHLEERGFDVLSFIDGEDALIYLYENRVDIILLDVKVPSFNGFEILKKIREENNTTPIIMVTSANSSKELKEGFDLGCDDYIKKPFEFEELDVRIDHIIKVYNLKSEVLNIKNINFYPKKNIIIIENKKIEISPKSAKILLYLYNKKNRIVSKKEIIENIWSYDDIPNDATIRSYIKDLRKIIPFIKTHRGLGYELEL